MSEEGLHPPTDSERIGNGLSFIGRLLGPIVREIYEIVGHSFPAGMAVLGLSFLTCFGILMIPLTMVLSSQAALFNMRAEYYGQHAKWVEYNNLIKREGLTEEEARERLSLRAPVSEPPRLDGQ